MFRISHILRTRVELPCPCCGQFGDIVVDFGGGEHQTYTETCKDCLHPRTVHLDLSIDAGGGVRVWLDRIEHHR